MIKTRIENTDRVIAQLSGIGARAQSNVRIAVRQLTVELQGYVKKNKLSGQALRRRTGTLSRSIDTAVIENSEGAIGFVSTNVKYGRAHEYGFVGAVNVKSHIRQIKKAWGRDIAPRSVAVNSFTRAMNLPERSFLRSSLGEMQGRIQTKLNEAVRRAMRPSGASQ